MSENRSQIPVSKSVGLKPLGDLVLVELDAPETVLASGLALPETAVKRPNYATVLAVGEGKVTDHGSRVSNGVVVGERVLIAEHSGFDIKIGERKVLLIKAIDVLAVVE